VLDVCATPADSSNVGNATGDDVPDVPVLLLARDKELVLDLDDCTPSLYPIPLIQGGHTTTCWPRLAALCSTLI
jgi:hypothetical protein